MGLWFQLGTWANSLSHNHTYAHEANRFNQMEATMTLPESLCVCGRNSESMALIITCTECEPNTDTPAGAGGIWNRLGSFWMQQHGLINILTLNFLSAECLSVVQTVCMCVWEDYSTDPVLWASWVSLSISQQCERAWWEREGVNGIARALNPSEGKFRGSWDNVFDYDDNACFQSSSFKRLENADRYFVGRNSFKFYLNTFCISHTL